MADPPAAGRNISSTASYIDYLLDIVDFSYQNLWRDQSFLHQKYVVEKRSITQIAAEILSSRATVRAALIRSDIKRRERGQPGLRPAQVPYGYRREYGLIVPHEGEQRVISMAKKMRDRGMSLREICDFLTSTGVPTKRRGVRWQPEMVRRVLGRKIEPDELPK